jgi:D-serine deaminase-like pyridoxal phosphate-dependent protein
MTDCPYLNKDFAKFPVASIETPAVIVDLQKMIKNSDKVQHACGCHQYMSCLQMLKIAKDRGLTLRPHAKTHKTLGVRADVRVSSALVVMRP